MKYLVVYTPLGEDLAQTHELSDKYSMLLYNTDFIINFQMGFALIMLSFLICLAYFIYEKKVIYNIQKSSKNLGIDGMKLMEQKF